ncbi:MAG: signal transduction histidine kinase [Planctomycetota bacterium]|jgi:signal transduction histidine kinase
MTLRTRLFLIFGALIAVLASAELWLVGSLAKDLDREAEGLAVSIGSGVMELISEELGEFEVIEDEDSSQAPKGSWLMALRGQRSENLPMPEEHQLQRQVIVDLSDGIHSIEGRLPQVVAPNGPHNARITFEVKPMMRHEGLDEELMLFLQTETFGSPDPTHEYGREPHLAPTRIRRMIGSPPAPGVMGGSGQGITLGLSTGISTGGGTLAGANVVVAETGRGVPVKREGLRRAIDHFLTRLILGSAAILGFGLLVAGFVAHRVSHPLRQLSQAARKVGKGEFGAQVEPEGDAEVRETLAAFNAMSLRLSELDAEAEQLREGQHLSELGDLARGLAHSLRNPLHVLGLSVDKLATEPNPELAATARAHIGRVDRTLRTLLALSSSGGEVLEDVDVVDLARDVALELLQDPNGQANTKVVASGPALIAGIGAELRAVLHVLVVNAVEASPPGSLVEVVVRPLPDGVEVLVLDEGSGLAPEVRERLFTPHTTTKAEGAGMGLYLAQRIATNRYGGSLELKDRATGGTEARMVLQQRKQLS